MSSAITNAGEALIALKQNQEAPLIIDKFILANVAGVDPAAAVDRTEGKPTPGTLSMNTPSRRRARGTSTPIRWCTPCC